MEEKVRPIIFFDGVCAVCNRTVDFILKKDPGVFFYAPLQGTTAKDKLSSDLLGSELKTMVLLDDEGIHIKSRAILRILFHLGWPWKIALVFRIIPKGFSDCFYDFFAEHRYRWFGKYDVCRIPSPQERSRFLD